MHGLQRGEVDELLAGEGAELHPARLLVGVQHRLVDGGDRDVRLVLLFVLFLSAGRQGAGKNCDTRKEQSCAGFQPRRLFTECSLLFTADVAVGMVAIGLEMQ